MLKISKSIKTKYLFYFKGTLLGLRQFLATKSPFKMMKNVFYFTLKALFVLKIFKSFIALSLKQIKHVF